MGIKIEKVSKEQAKVQIINSIKQKYGHLRQASKNITFACTVCPPQ
jgi:hypothetical protein